MFTPQYTLSPTLLKNIKQIAVLEHELSQVSLPSPVTREALMQAARERASHSSTSIEGNPLSLTDVKRLLKAEPDAVRDSEREVLNYHQALLTVQEAAKTAVPLTLPFILDLHRQVTDDLLASWKSGAMRQEPVFLHNPETREVVYWPPDHGDVPGLLDELLAFVREQRETLDPLLLAGIFHKQFVIIHPFMDGNGRTVRLLTDFLLASLGVPLTEMMSFASFYNTNLTAYFATVGVFGNYYDLKESVDFTDWLTFFTSGIVDELLRLRESMNTALTHPGSGLKTHHQAILAYLTVHGFITDKVYATFTDRARATRHQDFRKLIDLGLIERKGQGRASYYVLSE